MIGLILAAGRGHRLSELTGSRPKCLAELHGRSLLSRQLDLLSDAGVGDVAVVAGHEYEAVKALVGRRARLVRNEHYASSNSLYSFWLARALLVDGFVVLNCDVVLHPQLLDDLLTCRHDAALLYGPPAPGQRYSDEEMKVHVRQGRVRAIRKTLPAGRIDGENVGVARFERPAVAPLLDEVATLVSAGGIRQWLPAAFDAFAVRHELYAIPTRGYPWTEIDSPDDYRHARDVVLPAIAGATPAARRPAPGAAAEGSVQHV